MNVPNVPKRISKSLHDVDCCTLGILDPTSDRGQLSLDFSLKCLDQEAFDLITSSVVCIVRGSNASIVKRALIFALQNFQNILSFFEEVLFVWAFKNNQWRVLLKLNEALVHVQ
jgi:hypothetical protein